MSIWILAKLRHLNNIPSELSPVSKHVLPNNHTDSHIYTQRRAQTERILNQSKLTEILRY